CNENLREKRIHRNCARSPGGMPRRVFCCTTAHAAARGGFLVFAKKQENTGEDSHALSTRPQRKSVPTPARSAQSATRAGAGIVVRTRREHRRQALALLTHTLPRLLVLEYRNDRRCPAQSQLLPPRHHVLVSVLGQFGALGEGLDEAVVHAGIDQAL